MAIYSSVSQQINTVQTSTHHQNTGTATRKHVKTTAVHLSQDHNVGVPPSQHHKLDIPPSPDFSISVPPLQNHIIINSKEVLRQMFLDSFHEIGTMPGKYRITLDTNIPLLQHRRCRISIEAKEDIEAQLKEMTVQGIITLQLVPTPWVSSLTYPCKVNGTMRVCLDPKDSERAIICGHHKAAILE